VRTVGQVIGCLSALTGVAFALIALYFSTFTDPLRDLIANLLTAALIVGVFGLVLFAVSRWAGRR